MVNQIALEYAARWAVSEGFIDPDMVPYLGAKSDLTEDEMAYLCDHVAKDVREMRRHLPYAGASELARELGLPVAAAERILEIASVL